MLAPLSTALAQEGGGQPIRFDATGPDAPPLAARGPVSLWSADGLRRGELRFSGLGEGAGGLLELSNAAGTSSPILSFASGLNASAAWAPIDRVGFGATASLWGVFPAGTVALGSLRLEAPIRVVPSDDGPAVAVTPWVGIPLGGANAGVSSPGVSGGLMAAARVPLGPVEANVNLGGSARRSDEFPTFGDFVPTQTIGGPSVDFGAAVGIRPGRYEADLELRGAWSVAAGAIVERPEVPEADLFSELLVSAGGPLSKRVRWKAGAGTGLSLGIGTAVARGFLGLAWSDRAEPDLQIVDTPDPTAVQWTLSVTGAGRPLPGAVVTSAGSEIARTSGDGRASFPLSDWRSGVVVEAPGFASAAVDLPKGGGAVRVDLVPKAVPVPIRVATPSGEPLEPAITAKGADGASVGARQGVLELLPGDWGLSFELDGYGTQTRQITILPGVAPDPLEVVLLPASGDAVLVHTVRDAEGSPVPGATVLLDGLPIGTTGEDGTIEIASLAPGDHVLSIQHPTYTAVDQAVALTSGRLEVETPMARVPGTIKVSARNGDGAPVPDAVVRFAGPRRLAPMPLGVRGERTEVLGPGTWQLLVSSMQYGFQQREVVVPEDSWEVLEIVVVLQPSEGGQARLEVRVVDPAGIPVGDATIALDGKDFGTTSTGGVLALDGLNAGQRQLTVRSDHHRDVEPVPVVLVDGLQEEVVTLPWEAGTVRVTARTPSGVISDAQARFAGPERLPAADLGASGSAYFHVEPGEWSVLVTSPTYGIQQRQLVVSEDSRILHDITVVLNAPEGGLANLGLAVTDPEGAPVDGAAVFLDSIPLGKTSAGTLRAEELSVGRRVLEVESPYFQPWSQTVQLLEGDVDRDVELDWGPGTVKVRVRDHLGRPVPDGVVRLLGARSIAPSPVNERGERLFALEPGEWQALAISPTLGLTQVPVLVTDESDGLQVVDAVIRPSQAGLADVVLRVVDQGGRPVSGAEVSIDGQARGTTPPGGVLLVQNLVPGELAVSVKAPHHAPASVQVEVVEGSQVRYATLRALPGRLEVVVRDTDGRPVDAVVSLIGPEDWMPMNVGTDGKERFVVSPGIWQVVASAPGLAAGRADAVIPPEGQASVALELTKSRVERVGSREVVIRDVVLFDFNAATLRAEADPLLDEVANTLVSNPEIIRVEVQGHSDSLGDLAYNLTLSQRRAESVRKALITRGVAPEKLVARGYGAQRPVQGNDTESGRAANRRVEFEILE
ncbi:MAG: OmpA family protein [Myxococcota bacterium]